MNEIDFFPLHFTDVPSYETRKLVTFEQSERDPSKISLRLRLGFNHKQNDTNHCASFHKASPFLVPSSCDTI